jgi:cytochrome c
MLGEGAKNKIGPQLNGIVGRPAGTVEGYRYSAAMRQAGDDGLVWSAESLDEFLSKPRAFLKGTKMAFAGLKDAGQRADLIAYLSGAETAADDAASEPAAAAARTDSAPKIMAKDVVLPSHGVFHLGRRATPAEIAAWDIDVRPDGTGLPDGKGTVAQGEVVFTERCASCHGDFGEGRGRWPVLAGGFDTLTAERPVKTIGSYWPYLSTVFDYVRRAMPFGDARSLTDDEVYALTAYLLYLNDIVTDEEFELSRQNFTSIHLGNEENFIADDRTSESHYAEKSEPCMKDCGAGAAKVTMRARILDVTPDSDDSDTNEGAGSVD